MVQLESDSNWLKRGRQRWAIAQILQRPMTSSEIWHAAQAIAPRIQLRDVWFILRQMEQRKLVTCFNPKELTGKIFYWAAPADTDRTSRRLIPTRATWHRYASVMRGKNRRLVLLELARRDRKSASQIRRGLNERHPVSLNSVIRAVKDLIALRLITVAGEGEKRGQKIYRLTAAGRRIAELLAHRTDSPQSLLNPATQFSP